MTFLPVVSRELRVASRRRATHWMRFFAALTVIGVAFVLLMGAQRHTPPARLGNMIFMATSIIGFAFALLAGTFLTADCLCSERRDGTLGLLFLTDLRGYDVVLGKLAATSAVAVYALLAILPMLGLPLLMGGVTAGEFGRMCLVLLVTLLLSLASGLVVSALCTETRTAMLGSFGIMLALTGGLFLAAWGVWAATRVNPIYTIMIPSPLGAFIFSFDSGMTRPVNYWLSIGTLTGIALLLLAVACRALPRLWQHTPVLSSRRPSVVEPKRLRQYVLFENPFAWLARRDRFPHITTRIVLTVLLLIWLGFFIASYGGRRGTREFFLVISIFMAFGLHVIMKGMVAVQASRRFSEDRASGALELLLATPLRVTDFLAGQWQALRRQCLGWIHALAVMNFLLVVRFVMFNEMNMRARDVGMFSMFFLGGIVLLYADFIALGWSGMFMGLRGHKHHRAVLHALGRVMLLPWVFIFLFIFVGISTRASQDAMTGFFILWAAVSLVIAGVETTRRRAALHEHFRRLAAGEAIPRPLQPWEARAHWPSLPNVPDPAGRKLK